MTQKTLSAALVVCACAWSSTAGAQTNGSTVASTPGPVNRAMSWAMTKLDGSEAGPSDGFYPEMGGLITGAGISAGPGYRHRLFDDRMVVDVSGAVSWRRYSMMQATVGFPKLLNGRLEAGAQARYNDFTQINFFGVGGRSAESDQTDFRLKYVDAGGYATVHASRWLAISGHAGLLQRASISSGRSTLHPSIEQLFDDGAAPGLAQQPNYLHADVAIDADTRDVPGYPSSGGRYRLSMASFHDRDLGQYSFRRVEAEASQYVSLGPTVLGVRGRMDLTQTANGQQIPFYMMPSLGSSGSLPGYSDYRFRDRNAALVSAELRFPMMRMLDGAMFYDAGSVAPTVGRLTGRIHTDYGAGVRLHSRKNLIVRFDLARSVEGTRAIISFTPSLSFAKHSVAPFVP